MCICFVKQKTAYEVRMSDWSSDVCSSDLRQHHRSLKRLGAGYGAYRPAHDVDVLLLHQPFVPLQLSVIPIRVIAVEKAADHEIGLPCAAVPGAKAKALQSGFTIHHPESIC